MLAHAGVLERLFVQRLFVAHNCVIEIALVLYGAARLAPVVKLVVEAAFSSTGVIAVVAAVIEVEFVAELVTEQHSFV